MWLVKPHPTNHSLITLTAPPVGCDHVASAQGLPDYSDRKKDESFKMHLCNSVVISLGSHYIVTCHSDEALEWYHKGLVAYVTYREDPLPFVSRALEMDDLLLLGHCLATGGKQPYYFNGW